MAIQTKQAKQFFAAIMTGEVSRGQVRSWSRRLKNLANRRTSTEVDDVMCDENEIIDEMIDKIRPKADPAFAASGLKVLRGIAMTPSGRARRTVIGDAFNEDQRCILRADNCVFMLERFEPVWGRYCVAAPAVWRCYAEGIGGFSYRLLPWQTCRDPWMRLAVQ